MTLSLEMKWLTINLLTQKYPAEAGLEKEKLTMHSGLEMFFFALKQFLVFCGQPEKYLLNICP